MRHFKSHNPPFALQEIYWAFSDVYANVDSFSIARILSILRLAILKCHHLIFLNAHFLIINSHATFSSIS